MIGVRHGRMLVVATFGLSAVFFTAEAQPPDTLPPETLPPVALTDSASADADSGSADTDSASADVVTNPAATPYEVLSRPDYQPMVRAKLGLLQSSIQRLTVPEGRPVRFSATIELDGQPVTLSLEKQSIRASDFKLMVQRADDGSLVEEEPPPVSTYRGMVDAYPDAYVRASLIDGKLHAIIHASDETFGVQPVSDAEIESHKNDHVVYRMSDSEDVEGNFCGTSEKYRLLAESYWNPGANPTSAGTGLSIAELGTDADFEFYQKNGNSVSNTVLDIERVINGFVLNSSTSVAAAYEDNASINITFELTTMIVRTVAADPYSTTDSSGMLCELRATWDSLPESDIRRDAAHLFTGKVIAGPPIGVAYLFGMCNTSNGIDPDCPTQLGRFQYGVSESRYSGSNTTRRVALTAHELAHNFGASHCTGSGCHIMCDTINGCGGLPPIIFGTAASGQISSFISGESCFANLSAPQTLPFSDNFESGISSSRWSYVDGVGTTTAAVSEPSPVRTLNLDATGNDAYENNEIRSNFIQLGGETSVLLTYYTQHRFVENGESLFVEYWGSNRAWNVLNEVISDGTTQSLFDMHQHSLPANARHDEFRLRFRANVNQTDDDWYIDDVSISTSVTIVDQPQSVTVCENEMVTLSVTASGAAPISYQWRVGGVDIGGATSSSLTFNAVTLSDAGDYTCFVSNAVSNVLSDIATLTVTSTASCDTGLFCDPGECSFGVCVPGTDPCPGQQCVEASQTCIDPAVVTCQLSSSSAAPGSTVDVELFVSDAINLRGYQTTLGISGPANDVSVDCLGGGIVIDEARSDWVFLNVGDAFSKTNCGNLAALSVLGSVGGFVSTDITGAPGYLVTYPLTIDAGAVINDVYTLTIEPFPSTVFTQPPAAELLFTIGPPCTLTIQNCVVFPYGDVDLDFDVDIFDVTCVFDEFSSGSSSCLFANVDIAGFLGACSSNGTIDVFDVTAVIDAFESVPGCADPCVTPSPTPPGTSQAVRYK